MGSPPRPNTFSALPQFPRGGRGIARESCPPFAPLYKGSVAELLIANAIIVQSGGRLKVSRLWPDDYGVDFRLGKKGASESLELQVKSAFAVREGAYLRFRVDLSEVPRASTSYHVVAAQVLPGTRGLGGRTWVIPGAAFPRPTGPGTQYRFTIPLHSKRGSRWDQFGIPTRGLAGTLGSLLAGGKATTLQSRQRWQTAEYPMLTRGFVGENALVYAVAVTSEGRLAAFRPVADVIGLDLSFMALDGADTMAAQVKAPFLGHSRQEVVAQVDDRTFRPRSDRLLIVAPYVPALGRSAPFAWAMRMDEFAALCPVRRGKRNFFASPRPGGKFAPHRYALQEVGPFIETLVAWRAFAGPRAPLATRREEVARIRNALAAASRFAGPAGGAGFTWGGPPST